MTFSFLVLCLAKPFQIIDNWVLSLAFESLSKTSNTVAMLLSPKLPEHKDSDCSHCTYHNPHHCSELRESPHY